ASSPRATSSASWGVDTLPRPIHEASETSNASTAIARSCPSSGRRAPAARLEIACSRRTRLPRDTAMQAEMGQGLRAYSAPADIPAALETLRAMPRGEVLSAFLDTAPETWARKTYALTFRDGYRRIADALDRDAARGLDEVAERVDRYLAEQFVPRHPG